MEACSLNIRVQNSSGHSCNGHGCWWQRAGDLIAVHQERIITPFYCLCFFVASPTLSLSFFFLRRLQDGTEAEHGDPQCLQTTLCKFDAPASCLFLVCDFGPLSALGLQNASCP